MSILGWIILGGLAGWIASALTGSRAGCLSEIVIGIVGAMLGGFLFSFIGRHQHQIMRLDLGSLFVAVVGAVVLIVIVRALRGRG